MSILIHIQVHMLSSRTKPVQDINIYTLLVWVSVRLYPINVKAAQPIMPKFCMGTQMTPGKVYRCSKWQKFVSIFFLIFETFGKCAFFLNPRTFLFLFFIVQRVLKSVKVFTSYKCTLKPTEITILNIKKCYCLKTRNIRCNSNTAGYWRRIRILTSIFSRFSACV